jgi:beta-xylosidase
MSSAGVAVSDSPTGPFRYVDFFRPVPAELHKTFSTETDADQYERGSTFRDMALFKDDDGRAYIIYAAESNYTMHILELTDDYCGVRPLEQGKTWNRILIKEHREAPAPFKYGGKYYLMTSGCSGWKANAARVYVSDNILGPYTSLGNPCHGWNSGSTFDSQSTFVLPIDPEKGRFMYMGDRWNPKSIGESRYVWLPLIMEDGQPVIKWEKNWNLSAFDR